MSRKVWTGGGGWVPPNGANSMAVSGLRGRKFWLALGGPFLSLLMDLESSCRAL